jgi:hypothetical protein
MGVGSGLCALPRITVLGIWVNKGGPPLGTLKVEGEQVLEYVPVSVLTGGEVTVFVVVCLFFPCPLVTLVVVVVVVVSNVLVTVISVC